MKNLYFLTLLFLSSPAWAGVASRIEDGNIRFALYTINGTPAFSAAERDNIIARQGGSAVPVNPSFYETAISTTFPAFTGIDDFRQTLSDKSYIAEKAVSLDLQLQAYQDLKARYPSLPLTGKINKLVAQIDLLFSIYTSLP